MDFELRRAREKLEREQKDRKEKARMKQERERKAKQEAARQREAIEAVQRSRRLDAAEAQLKVPFLFSLPLCALTLSSLFSNKSIFALNFFVIEFIITSDISLDLLSIGRLRDHFVLPKSIEFEQ